MKHIGVKKKMKNIKKLMDFMHQIYVLIQQKHVIQDIINPQNSPNTGFFSIVS